MRQFQPTLFTAFYMLQTICLLAAVANGLSSSNSQQVSWKPSVSNLEDRRNLRGMNHQSETIGSLCFHHVEFYCGDAKSTASQFASCLGMQTVGSTSQATGNDRCVSYGLESGDFRLLLTAPYSRAVVSEGVSEGGGNEVQYDAPDPLPGFQTEQAHSFFSKHGLAARAVGVRVVDAQTAHESAVYNGAISVTPPTFVPTCPGQQQQGTKSKGCWMAEVKLYGDVVLRFVSFPADVAMSSDKRLPFLPHLAPSSATATGTKDTFGIERIDHAVGNVHNLQQTYEYIKKFTGFHEFAEFTSEDIGTVDSGLNSVVLASDSENVLLPLNEPTMGARKSQILTYLEQNEGAGLQHLALKSSNIFDTVKRMRQMEDLAFGFDLMKRPSDEYYKDLPSRLGTKISDSQYSQLEQLGILADADDEGVLFQLFTKPIGDRPTFFIEIIQRSGCEIKDDASRLESTTERPGCGGFGQGNFKELFKSIEEHEKSLKV